jgi:hypothetical protein
MSIVRAFGTALVISAASTATAAAQQAMSEPAYCAFFYPNANCQDKGPGNPYTDPNYRRNGAWGAAQGSNPAVDAQPKRTRKSYTSR